MPSVVRRQGEFMMTVPGIITAAEYRKYDIISQILIGLALFAVLYLSLLAALITAVLVYELVHVVAPRLRVGGLTHRRGKAIALILLSLVLVLIATLAVMGMASFLMDSSDNVIVLMRKMADVVQAAKTFIPGWARDYIPANAEEWQSQFSEWLRENAGALQKLGENFGRILLHIIIGAVIGGLAALGDATPAPSTMRPLKGALLERARTLGEAFRRVVFAQIRISALNTVLTAIYLVVILPMFGIQLPLIKTMIAVTFLAGLLPAVGNLISNTVIVIVSLGVSAYAAIGSLIFLVLIHKLEYFVNARIVGGQIRARAWEILTAMLVLEAAFGIAGLIAAPIYYAYLKEELLRRSMI